MNELENLALCYWSGFQTLNSSGAPSRFATSIISCNHSSRVTLISGAVESSLFSTKSFSIFRAVSQDIGVLGPPNPLEFFGLSEGPQSMIDAETCCLGK